MRVERVDPFHVAVISEAGEALTVPNAEFLKMMHDIEIHRWDLIRRDAEAHRQLEAGGRRYEPGSAARIRT